MIIQWYSDPVVVSKRDDVADVMVLTAYLPSLASGTWREGPSAISLR